MGEIIVVDSGSSDHTVEIAKSFGAKVFVEEWKGFAAQKNSAIDKATEEYVLSLDADEEVSAELAREIEKKLQSPPVVHDAGGGGSAGVGGQALIKGFWFLG